MVFRFGIDEKSLFIGAKNVFRRGQSAIVHTPLNQSRDKEKWRKEFYQIFKIRSI